MYHDRLTILPSHILARITGDRRRRLVEYLLRWGEPSAALACLDCWLATQPHLITLREARARVLIELAGAEAALDILDGIDAERGMSESRRALRLRALAALGRWGEAHALLPEPPADASAWRLRAELLTRQGRFDDAAAAYAQIGGLLPEGSPPPRGIADLALARGEPARARALLLLRQSPDLPADTRDLLLLRVVARQLDDAGALATLDAQLDERRAAERVALDQELGFDADLVDEQASGRASDRANTSRHPIVSRLASEEPAVSEELHVALHDHFGYSSFRPGQAAIIERVMRGESTLAVLPTGAGKSLTYQLPTLLLSGATLVISPLIALMKDQIDNLPPALAERAITIHSGLDANEVAARLQGVADGRYVLIYAAPERLRQQPFVHALRCAGVARVVVDEAHCVSLWGMSFRPDYLFIRRALDALGAPPVLALTATATAGTEAEIKRHLAPGLVLHQEHLLRQAGENSQTSRSFAPSAGEQMVTIRTSIFRPNLSFEVAQVANKHEKLDLVARLCRTIDGPVLVYVRSRDGCEEVAARLRAAGVAAEHYHAQVSDRAAVQDRFMRGATRVLVATVAFGMGIDKADVRAILHYNLPQSVEAYYQEAGRAGRDGRPARCVLLYAANDKGQLTAWLREEALSKAYLREVYRRVRQRIPGTWGAIAIEDLRRDLREEDESRMRVALGLLERVGLLKRHFDLPRAVTLLVPGEMAGDHVFRSFMVAARLRAGQPLDVDLIALAERAGYTPDALERQLLLWHDQGLVRYQSSARDVLLELRAPAADTGEQIDALLAEYSTSQDARIAAIAAYARGLACRHHAIAAHFGEQLAACRSACDICAPSGQKTTDEGRRSVGDDHSSFVVRRSPEKSRSSAQLADVILAAVSELPGQLSDKQLVCVLLGEPGYPQCAAFGQLAGADFGATRAAVARLIAAGRLALRSRTLILATPAARPSAPDAIDELIERCLAHLPFLVGVSGLVKILKGAAGSPVGPDRCAEYAMLSHMTGAAIEAAIGQLIARGRLRRSSGSRPLLALATHTVTAPANVVQ
jgi:ATP-dependent DNA helicase RecQ